MSEQETKMAELVDNLIQIFSNEPPDFAINVLSMALGVVIAHCDPEDEEALHHQFDSNVAVMIQTVRGINKNEAH
jgi:hypothetical protein